MIVDLLAKKISQHNRSEQSLGYIHSATQHVVDDQNYLYLFGQTDGSENAVKTIQGWETVLSRLKSGEIKDEEIQASISSVANSMTRERTMSGKNCRTYVHYLDRANDAKGYERAILP